MERKEQEPFDREAWRKLLGADGGAPTKEIDRRILADARRALVPRIARWWLPASLAATLLLAVLIVQWQLVDVGKPAAVTEADVPATAPANAALQSTAPAVMEAPAPRQDAPASAVTSMSPPLVDQPRMEASRMPVESAPAAAAPAPEERVLQDNQTPSAISAGDAETLAEAGRTQEQGNGKSNVTLGLVKARESPAESRTPERWYADIAALRAAGHNKEADAELARFKAKYPDWLTEHHQKDP